jgi:CheY-like chemotaxis protein
VPLRILVIDDSEADLHLLRFALEDAALKVDCAHRVETAPELAAALEEREWDLCLLDWVMPCLTTPEALRVIRQSRQPQLPCIVWSGRTDEKVRFVAQEALGAVGYLAKSQMARIIPALIQAHVPRYREAE